MFNSISYLRRYRDPHGALEMLGAACRRVRTVQLVRVPMHPVLMGSAKEPGSLSILLGKLFGHLRLIPRAYAKKEGRALFVREFLTVPLFIIAPFIWPQRRSMWFMCHHNVGHAARRPSHHFMLKVLYAAGFRFVVCETRDTWKPIAAQPDPARVIAMPTPIPDYLVRQTPLRQGAERKMVIGFIGSFRAEKSPLWALDQVAKAQDQGRFAPGIELLIGTADTDFLQRWEGRALLIDTTARADYLRALEACDVVVLPYDEASYSYRVSGVLAEAVALGCLVVAPDLPALCDQVLRPLPVGVCYKDRLELVDCVQRAIVMAGEPSAALATQAHRDIRSLDAVVAAIALMGAS